MTASEPALAAEADTDADTDAGVEPMTSAVVEPLAGDGLGKFCVRVPVQALALAFANFFAAASLAKALPAAAPDQGQAPALSQLFGTSLPQDLTVLEAVPC